MENRKDFLSDCLTVTQGVDLAEALLARSHGPIIMNEASDNPGAGTPGDGTFLLRELIRRDIPKTCCGAIIDPQDQYYAGRQNGCSPRSSCRA